jgi:hypothetical protein
MVHFVQAFSLLVRSCHCKMFTVKLFKPLTESVHGGIQSNIQNLLLEISY